jgi:hypothetical protein
MIIIRLKLFWLKFQLWLLSWGMKITVVKAKDITDSAITAKKIAAKPLE